MVVPRWVKWGGILVVALGALFLIAVGTSYAVFCARENREGAAAWAKAMTDLRAEGEPVTLAEMVPPPVSDEENVAKAPVFQELYEKERSACRLGSIELFFSSMEKEPRNAGAHFVKWTVLSRGAFLSLSGWQQWLTGRSDPATAAADVRRALEPYAGVAGETRKAVDRPFVRWPVTSPQNPFFEKKPYMMAGLKAGQFLQLRATAEIEDGDAASAAEDIVFLLRLSDVVGNGGTLVDFLVGVAIQGEAYGVMAQGMQSHAWTDAQLQRFEGILSQKNPVDAFVMGVRRERGDFVQVLGRPRSEILAAVQQTDEAKAKGRQGSLFLYRVIPQGWIDADKAFYVSQIQQHLLGAVDPAVGVVSLAEVEKGKEEVQHAQAEMLLHREKRLLSLLALPVLFQSAAMASQAQAYLDEARIACALERFRLSHGTFPADLAALIPDFLSSIPLDPASGKAFSYREEGDGYLLYSIGADGMDDGGLTGKGNKRGDWVWASRPDLYKFLPEKGP